MKKILIVFGTRPEAIKIAPLINALRAESAYFDLVVCVTAQHRHMLDQVLKIFNIKPDIDLNLMQAGQDLFDITAKTLLSMKSLYLKYKPDVLIVHGDTSTALSAALAGFYSGIPVAHVEAGLRTNNLFAPFPEEFNRQIISKIARWHFAPTKINKNNLLLEKVHKDFITITGNTVIDSMNWIIKRINTDLNHRKFLDNSINRLLPFDWHTKRYILITLHRRESFGNGLQQIFSAIRDLSVLYPKVNFVYSLHPNPNILRLARDILANLGNVHLIEPLDYEHFVYLLKNCYFVLTDSGGIQEEAPSLGKPVLVMRDITERPEAVSSGAAQLVGTNSDGIILKVSQLLDNKTKYLKMSKVANPYGDGNSCSRIIDVLKKI